MMSFKNIRREDASRAVIVHGILLTYTLVALYPIFLVVINAFKTRSDGISECGNLQP